jgi:curli biogenesis system outer membrane secretion channel CsgG
MGLCKKTGKRTAILAALAMLFIALLSGCADDGVRTFTKDLAQDAEDYRAAVGYQKTAESEDGTVTYTFTKSQLKDLKERYNADIQKKADEITKSKNKIESIKVIVFAKDFTQFDVYVDNKVYSVFDAAYVLPFLRTCAFMQVLNGKKADKVDAKMNIVTVDTKEWISSATYQKIFGEK